ncbi:MAG TPA: arylsulfatase [Edaphobacter sp.]|nr:arylsulfatase [Edaphobacter sp.]
MSVSRRSFLCSLIATTATASHSPLLKAQPPLASLRPKEDSRPNIIVIMADDMGFSDLGCYGGEVHTPNIDSLAESGLRFTQFYNCARCCPSRASLLTGLDNHQAGVGDMINDLGTSNYQGYLGKNAVTIAEALKGSGYRSLMVGKWHVGEEKGHWPVDRGFERYFGLISGACNYFRLDPGRKMALENQPYTPPANGFYMTDAFTDHAIALVDEYGKQPNPYFLYLAYTAPHWPLHAPPEDIERNKGHYREGWDQLRLARHQRQIKMGLLDERWQLTDRDPTVPAWENVSDKADLERRMEVYAAQIERMDQGIGRVIQKVKDLGQEENTLILFLADNGACHEVVERGKPGTEMGTADSFSSYGRGWANASNTPFRLYKHWVHEGGISAPLIAKWPRQIKRKNVFVRQPAHITDIMPTVLELAGVSYPRIYEGHDVIPLAGESLVPVLQGKSWKGHGAMYWEHEGNRAVREGKWKLVSRAPERWELYDMESDRTENHDLSGTYPEVVQRMTGMYEAWASKVGVLPREQILQDLKNRNKTKK